MHNEFYPTSKKIIFLVVFTRLMRRPEDGIEYIPFE